MPYSPHRAFSIPPAERTIWRYISFEQLLSILSNESLHFARADTFDDPFEGILPRRNIQEMDQSIGDVSLPETAKIWKQNDQKSVLWKESNLRTKIEVYRRISFLNCWHMLPHESVAMWDANLEGGNGIVIKSTVGGLKAALNEYSENEVFIGEVDYIDYQREKIPEDNILYSFTFKREGFRHENELRAVVTLPPVDGYPRLRGKVQGQEVPLRWDEQNLGLPVDIDVEHLTDEIRLSPGADDWHVPLVDELVTKYGYEISVSPSSLSIAPSYLD